MNFVFDNDILSTIFKVMLLQCVKSIVKKIVLVVLCVSCLCIKLVLVLRRSCDRGAMKKKKMKVLVNCKYRFF